MRAFNDDSNHVFPADFSFVISKFVSSFQVRLQKLISSIYGLYFFNIILPLFREFVKKLVDQLIVVIILCES